MPRMLPQCDAGKLSDQQTGKSYQLRWSAELLGRFCEECLPLLVLCHQPRTAHADWCRFSEELGSLDRWELDRSLALTKCVDEKVVLDLINIPKTRSIIWKAKPHEIIQEIYPLTNKATFLQCFQYTMGSRSRLSEVKGKIGGSGVTGLLHHSLLVVLSFCCMPQTGHKFHPTYGRSLLDLEH